MPSYYILVSAGVVVWLYFLKPFISNAVILSLSCVLIVHVPHPYIAVENMVLLRILTFVSLPCHFQILAILLSFVLAMASLRLISDVGCLFASILAPRYSKLSILSIYFFINFYHCLFFTFVLYPSFCFIFTFRCNSFLSPCSFTDFISLLLTPLVRSSNSAVSSAYRRSLIYVPLA